MRLFFLLLILAMFLPNYTCTRDGNTVTIQKTHDNGNVETWIFEVWPPTLVEHGIVGVPVISP